MTDQPSHRDACDLAASIQADIAGLLVRKTASERDVRRKYSRLLKTAPPDVMLDLAREMLSAEDLRWIAYELLANHKTAFLKLGEAELEALGNGIASWWSTDAFARILAGPAWLNGQVPDGLIHRWARCKDRWWRRAALVSTVALNMRTDGGRGDAPRTLAVCRMLIDDHDDMVVKAMSWALRALAVQNAEAVEAFLSEHERVLAARIKREVRNKLETGLKTPGRKKGG